MVGWTISRPTMLLRGLLGVALVLFAMRVSGHLTTSAQVPSAQPIDFEGAQTNPIRLSPDGSRLFAVNTSNGSLSVFNVSTPTAPVLIREIPVGLEPVSVNPRTRDEAWVVNQLSDSVSVVSVSQGIVTSTLNPGDEPMDVVFAGNNDAYVSVSRENSVAVFDAVSKAPVRVLRLFGGNPRALAASRDGTLVYAAFALSGNGTTVIPDDVAPPQPAPTNPALPPPPQVGKIVAATDPQWASTITYKMPDNDVAVISADAFPNVTGYYSGVGTINLGLAVNPANGDIWVANTDARNLVQFEPNLRGHWVDNRMTRITRSTGQVTPFDLNPRIDYSILPNPAALETALAQPTAVVFDPSGRFMYVAAFGTDRVAQVDTNGRVISFVEVSPPSGSGALADPKNKRGPRGLALQADGRTLYVLNRISNTISVVDTAQDVVVREIPVGTDNTPDVIRAGRGFLYDAKLSGNGTGSCASCHIDGDMDMLAWDLGNPGGNMVTIVDNGTTYQAHPMKGPMTTQSLRGLAGTGRLHWRGDKANFLEFNPAFDSLMGGPQLSDADMNAFAAFVDTILYQPNPYQNLDRTLPANVGLGNPASGFQVFTTIAQTAPGKTCNACHTANPGPGTDGHISPDSIARTQPFKTPQLRNIYQKQLFQGDTGAVIEGFGMHHDGHVYDLNHFLRAVGFLTYTLQQKIDMAAFMMAFDTGTAPAIGHTVTLSSGNLGDPQLQSDWATLEQQSVTRNIDLVVHGTLNGQVCSMLYRPFFNDYVSNTLPGVSLSHTLLQTAIALGDTLSFIGVPPREGINAGATSVAKAATGTVIRSGPVSGH